MNGQCVIFAGGEFCVPHGIENADFVIACDFGYSYAVRCGIRPDLLVGDFDSYHGSLPAGIPRLDLPIEKDDTDTIDQLQILLHETQPLRQHGDQQRTNENTGAVVYAAEHSHDDIGGCAFKSEHIGGNKLAVHCLKCAS